MLLLAEVAGRHSMSRDVRPASTRAGTIAKGFRQDVGETITPHFVLREPFRHTPSVTGNALSLCADRTVIVQERIASARHDFARKSSIDAPSPAYVS